jgi:hypothetical protein
MKALFFVAILLVTAPALAQPIPGSEGWLLIPTPGYSRAPRQMSPLDAALMRCYRAAIATGQFFLGDVNYILGRCQQPLAAWTAACERREGPGAAICLLGPQQAVGDALRDAWVHRNDLQGWLASLPPLPRNRPGQSDLGGTGSTTSRLGQSIGSK